MFIIIFDQKCNLISNWIKKTPFPRQFWKIKSEGRQLLHDGYLNVHAIVLECVRECVYCRLLGMKIPGELG